ncbi:hypothetical protein D018_0911A, partial [Vibrio parahaemolyticus VP2007-007]
MLEHHRIATARSIKEAGTK